MNCPNCGADNEAGTRFCIECGTPLEDQSAAAPPSVEPDDADRTILTTAPPIAEDAKTVAISQEDVMAAGEEARIEVEAPGPAEPEPVAPEPASPPPSAPAGSDSSRGGGFTNSRNIIIIAIVVLLILCCCCATLAIVGAASSDVIEDIMYELSMLPPHLASV